MLILFETMIDSIFLLARFSLTEFPLSLFWLFYYLLRLLVEEIV